MLRLAAASDDAGNPRRVGGARPRHPRFHALVAFGGNGPLFAARIAAEIGIGRVVVPPYPGVFSAFGLLLANTEHHVTRSLRLRLGGPDATALDAMLSAVAADAAARLTNDGFSAARQALGRTAMLRYVGQSSELAVALPALPGDALLTALPELFADAHEKTYGFRAPDGEPVELVGVSVIARGLPERPRLPSLVPLAGTGHATTRRAWFGGWQDVPVLDRAGLSEAPLAGPLIIQEYDATCLVPPGVSATCDAFGNVLLAL